MKFLRKMIWGAGVVTLLAHTATGRADVATNAVPDFKEVYDLVRSHLAGESEADLNRAAVQGLLNQLHSKVSLVSGTSETNKPDEGPLLSKAIVYEGTIACLRVGRVGEGLADKIASTYKQLSTTNHLKGVILDLRFADGHNYREIPPV